jgi:hypothetical protein
LYFLAFLFIDENRLRRPTSRFTFPPPGNVRRENETLQDAGFLKFDRTFMKRKQNDLNEKVLKFLNQ